MKTEFTKENAFSLFSQKKENGRLAKCLRGNASHKNSWPAHHTATGGDKGSAMPLASATLQGLQKLGKRKERDVFKVVSGFESVKQHVLENKAVLDDFWA